MKGKSLWIIPVGLLGVALVVFIGGEIVMQLWNWLMPLLFGWRTVTFWQAFGLLALCRILFGGWGAHRGRGDHRAIRHRLVDRMADRVAERWEAMSPEERERFRQRLRERMGVDPTVGSQ